MTGSDYKIHSIGFGEDWVEVAFIDTRHDIEDNPNAKVALVQSMMIRPRWQRDRFDSIKDEIAELLDESFRQLRIEMNKPKSEPEPQLPFEEDE